MGDVVAVSAVPIAVALVVGVGGFVALLPLLLSEPSHDRMHAPPPRPSRFRLVVTVGALVAWSVWSVRRPFQRGRHD